MPALASLSDQIFACIARITSAPERAGSVPEARACTALTPSPMGVRGWGRGRGQPPSALVLFILGLAHARLAFADDLEAGVSDAAVRFRKLVKVGVAVAAVVIVVIGLMVSGFKFSQKDPGAIWYLAGTAAGGALFGVAAALI